MSIDSSPLAAHRPCVAIRQVFCRNRFDHLLRDFLMSTYVTALVGAFLAALVATPIVRSLAIRYGIVDQPDPRRKLHVRVVARAGGVGVLLATMVGCALAMVPYYRPLTFDNILPFAGMGVGMLGICILGLADDIWTLRGRQKLVVQVILAAVLVSTGFVVHSIRLFGFDLQLGLLAAPVTIVWLLATTNALNLIDGSDGLCSTVGAIITGSLGVMAAMGHHYAEAAVAFAMCGALIGFLVFNFPPASIFLGDSGSLLVGMISGALALRCALKGPTTVAMVAPLAILIVPLFDSAMAIVRRKLTGRSIYTTDRAHLHHNIKERGFSDVGLLLVAGALCGFAAVGAIGGTMVGSDLLAAVGAAGVLIVLVASRVFGFAELMLIIRKLKEFAHSMLQPATTAGESVRHQAVRLQGSRNWEVVWATLTEFAERQGLSRVHLDLNVPWLHEGFHATWQRSRMPDRLERWSTSLPIHTSGRVFGRLDITGPVPTGRNFEVLNQLATILEDLEPQIESLLNESIAAPVLTINSESSAAPNLSPSRAS
ncbi:MAG: undecaprenyl/decaprenyl-phosphate alpha-N-acetylglucosaminyl 1-phosphate transferase [Pirellulaceae bacterium]|nr:undecaprenyl/decaprenyl-phosphate alpha-N-acetylglucosaminyl 1-phosphate transferase [Pirellulaceae bacterium]